MSKVEIMELDFKNSEHVRQAAEAMQLAFSQPPWHRQDAIEYWLNRVRSWNVKPQLSPIAFLAKVDGKVVGCASGHLHNAFDKPREVSKKLGAGLHYYGRDMAVHPKFQRSGVGKALLEAHISYAKGLGCTKIYAQTHVDNARQINNYRKGGFEEFHREDSGPHPDAFFSRRLRPKATRATVHARL